MVNFNNPEHLNMDKSSSTVSVTLDNPFVAKPIDYGDFRSSDPLLNNILPKKLKLNMGITSPGFVDDQASCTGLDFMNTNPDYNKIPFKVCLDKYGENYQIPEMAFDNLLNNLPYTFSALSEKEKKRYLDSLQKFINENKSKSTDNIIKSEHFENRHSKHENRHSKHENRHSKKENNKYLYILIIVIISLIFLLFITKLN